MATLDELTQRSDLIHLSVHITKTLVSSFAAAGATAVAVAVAEVCVSVIECACVCTYAQI